MNGSSPSESEMTLTHLLTRSPTDEYLQEWKTSLIKKKVLEEMKDNQSVLVFRLGNEWFALPTVFFKEVAHIRNVHTIPHNKHKILEGFVNLNGELQLCISLRELLEIEQVYSKKNHSGFASDRMIAIVNGKDLWVFQVNEIDRIHLWHLSQLENVPVNLSKSRANFLKGIMNENNRSVGLLDVELLFYYLNSMLKV